MKTNNFSGFIGCILDGLRVLFGFKLKIDLVSDIVVGPGGSLPKPTPTPPPGMEYLLISVPEKDFADMQKKASSGGYVIIPLSPEVYEILGKSDISKSSIFYSLKNIDFTPK